MVDIFNDRLLRFGPWQEFERNMARLLLHTGWRDVRIVGRSGDGGADVLGIDQNHRVWIFQCKFSSRTRPGKSALDEVRNAGQLYGADVLCVVTSLSPSASFDRELQRLRGLGLAVHHIGPSELIRTSRRANPFAEGQVQLREYQSEALELLRAAVLESGRALVVLATGLGKTVIISELVSDLIRDDIIGEGRVLVLAHTVPLVNQLLMSFWKHLPKSIPTHRLAAGEKPTSFEGITFATIQSFSNLEEVPFFDLVIVDEAHHFGAPEYRRVIEALDAPRLVGVTATPWRTDGVSIEHWFGEPVFTMGIKEGLALGYLSNVDYRILVDDIDWRMVAESSQYGYTIAQLNKKLLIPTRDEEAIREVRKVFDAESRSRGLIFSPSKAHARSFASDLRRHGFAAASLTSDDDHITRFKRIGEFGSGRLQFLCVVDIFNEGIDVPNVDLIVFLRVTHSRRIFIQQLGRGLRISDTKDELVVLDFAADVRRIHAALDLTPSKNEKIVERLPLSYADVNFRDRSMGNFFHEWIADLGNLQDYDEDDVVYLPILDPHEINFPEPL